MKTNVPTRTFIHRIAWRCWIVITSNKSLGILVLWVQPSNKTVIFFSFHWLHPTALSEHLLSTSLCLEHLGKVQGLCVYRACFWKLLISRLGAGSASQWDNFCCTWYLVLLTYLSEVKKLLNWEVQGEVSHPAWQNSGTDGHGQDLDFCSFSGFCGFTAGSPFALAVRNTAGGSCLPLPGSRKDAPTFCPSTFRSNSQTLSDGTSPGHMHIPESVTENRERNADRLRA